MTVWRPRHRSVAPAAPCGGASPFRTDSNTGDADAARRTGARTRAVVEMSRAMRSEGSGADEVGDDEHPDRGEAGGPAGEELARTEVGDRRDRENSAGAERRLRLRHDQDDEGYPAG